ncbi:hypothetical protein B2G71_15935 [Novosphingobium sp. PC22D]|uniref:cupin domain-containing protein n=1 Tax=Novosphingobium sp. PC22D TaxID=1962403 RepID=UPI000BF06C3A|nr:cupin domain-containing protein [Novosphingobium sp. PC22D]PEQ11614.1 hypothetical protein B2G71_15935 [Novosphingobium sp. PC22D]
MSRRVVTGLDEAQRSCVIVDGPVHRFGAGDGGYVWRTEAVPADNAGRADIAPVDFSYDLFHGGGTNFFYVEMAPGTASSVHATDTIDYITMIRGAVVLVLDTCEVLLRAGDLVVDRGVIHSWRNDGPDACAYAVVTVPAYPVGEGRTV